MFTDAMFAGVDCVLEQSQRPQTIDHLDKTDEISKIDQFWNFASSEKENLVQAFLLLYNSKIIIVFWRSGMLLT